MTQTSTACPFCLGGREQLNERILIEEKHFFSVYDGFPISEGHALVIANRHIGSLFETSSEERESFFNVLEETKRILDAKFNPNAYNIGINDGQFAGQTVPHLHVHLIPRYEGDVKDPRGGVRWLFPDKADYWSK